MLLSHRREGKVGPHGVERSSGGGGRSRDKSGDHDVRRSRLQLRRPIEARGSARVRCGNVRAALRKNAHSHRVHTETSRSERALFETGSGGGGGFRMIQIGRGTTRVLFVAICCVTRLVVMALLVSLHVLLCVMCFLFVDRVVLGAVRARAGQRIRIRIRILLLFLRLQ